MIPLMIPNLAGREGAYLQECVNTNFVSSVGPFVDRFEQLMAEACGAPYGVATSAGTTGLHAALMALGVKPGELVIAPSYTFIASVNAISHCGAAPWLLDIAPDSWTLDAELLRRELTENTDISQGALRHRKTGQRVAAVLPVFTMGLPADMDRICQITADFGVPVVADAAAALGATYKGRMVADLGAHLTVFSFNGNKTVTAGGGGGVVSHDRGLIDKVRHLTTTARVGDGYDHDAVGYNYRMTNIQAAVGCAQMELLEGFVQTKRSISRTYENALCDMEGVSAFPAPEWGESACWVSGVVLQPPAPGLEIMIEGLRSSGIAARPFWKPMHMQAPYRDALQSAMPVTNDIWERVQVLPCSTNLTQDEKERVILAFRNVYDAKGPRV